MGLGSLFFFIGTKYLIGAVREENLVKGFVRSIDAEGNGFVSQKEIKEYLPCDEFDNKFLLKAYRSAGGRRVDVGDLTDELTEAQILKAIKVCKGNYAELTDLEHIKNGKPAAIAAEMMNTFDISKNHQITWSEYHLINFANRNPN